MVYIRKIITTRETVLSELGIAAPRPVMRAVGMAVILNPFAGRVVNDLRPLFEAGRCPVSGSTRRAMISDGAGLTG